MTLLATVVSSVPSRDLHAGPICSRQTCLARSDAVVQEPLQRGDRGASGHRGGTAQTGRDRQSGSTNLHNVVCRRGSRAKRHDPGAPRMGGRRSSTWTYLGAGSYLTKCVLKEQSQRASLQRSYEGSEVGQPRWREASRGQRNVHLGTATQAECSTSVQCWPVIVVPRPRTDNCQSANIMSSARHTVVRHLAVSAILPLAPWPSTREMRLRTPRQICSRIQEAPQ